MPPTKLSVFNLPWSTDWVALFGGVARPLCVEIGFGNGAYLIHLAQTHPDHHIIGLEISSESLEKAERKIAHARLTNAIVIHTRAETALPRLFEPHSVHAFHINYPDPWFKTRHSGRRLMQRDTLDLLVSRLETGGTLHLATDIRAYADMSHKLLQQTPQLDNLLSEPWLDQRPEAFTTKYEAKGLREGRHGHFFLYRRNALPALDLPVIRERDMSHLILSTPMPPSAILERFDPHANQRNEIAAIRMTHAFINHQGQSLLFEVSIDEPTIYQHVALILSRRDTPDHYTLRFAPIGHPRLTDGLHMAINVVADWIVSLHPEAHIVDRKVRTP